MKTNKEKDYLSKIFRVAIIFFATTIGIGLYALVGAPIKQSIFSESFDKVMKIGSSASVAVSNVVGFSYTKKLENNEIVIKLTKPSSDFQTLKTTLLDSKFKESTPSLVTFKADDKIIGIPLFLNYISDVKPSNSLLRIMGDSRYYVNNDRTFDGTVVVSLLDSEIAFASLTGWESKFIENTLPLVHPMFNKSDISMYMKLGAVSRKISGVDTRVIYKGKNEIVYMWGIYKNNLIITGSKDSYDKIINALD